MSFIQNVSEEQRECREYIAKNQVQGCRSSKMHESMRTEGIKELIHSTVMDQALMLQIKAFPL